MHVVTNLYSSWSPSREEIPIEYNYYYRFVVAIETNCKKEAKIHPYSSLN